MISIELRDILINAFHGVHEGENQTGNLFSVNLTVQYDDEGHVPDELDGTIDYVNLYNIVKQRMLLNTPLLEVVCDGIIRKIKHQYPITRKIDISIYKLHSPVENFEGKFGVTISRVFNE